MIKFDTDIYAASKEDVAEKIAACRAVQSAWASRPWNDRAKYIKAVQKYLGDHGDEIAEVIHQDNGKLKLDALVTEVLPAAMAAGYYCKRGKSVLRKKRVTGGNLLMFNKKSRIVYEPYGVVGIISPWNYPFAIPFSEIVMALLAGNGVILKVARDTLQVGRLLAHIFKEVNLPEHLFSYVELAGKDAGPAFIEGGVDKLFFTGSTAVGKELMERAAPRLLPLVLELGGADAAVVRSGADLDRAARGILWAGFSNAGQSCGGVQRVLVHRDVYQPFLDKLTGMVKSLRYGAGPNDDMGPMISENQKKTVQKQIDECISRGAVVAAENTPPGDDPRYAPAMVLTNLTMDMPIMRDEIFGPVVGVHPVKDDDEAVAIANASCYGLTGSVWSKNKREAMAVAQRLQAGAIMINDHLMSHGLAETPWGGFGDSGFGRTHGEMGLLEMVRSKVIVDDTLPGAKRNLWWHPYSEDVYRGMQAILSMVASFRFSAVPKVLKIFFTYWKK